MTEKVLGFKEKETKEKYFMGKEWAILVKRKDLVPVVSVEALEKFRLKKLKAMLNRDEERVYANGYLGALDDVLQEAGRLQAVEEKE